MRQDKLRYLERKYKQLGKRISLRQKIARELLRMLRKLGIYSSQVADLQITKLEIDKLRSELRVIASPIKFESSTTPKVSIVIPAYNQFEYTLQCLRSIYKHCSNIEYEVIVADDCSTDKTDKLKEYAQNIIHVRNNTNLGFLDNCNNAVQFAKGEYLVFLNNDTIVMPNWLDTLIETMEADPSVGMCGSKLIYPTGILQEAGGIILADAAAANYGNGSNPNSPEYNYIKEVDYISGASIMIRRTLWQDIGGFDPRYAPAYYEDVDLAFEVRKRHYKVIYQPLSSVIHFEGISHGTDIDKGIKAYQQINKNKLCEKWHNDLIKGQSANWDDIFHARSRSQGQQTIVVFDSIVPRYDKDAGSRNMYQYLRLLLTMGFNVKFVPADFHFAAEYTIHLQQLGIEVLYGEDYKNNWQTWLSKHSPYIDFVFLSRPDVASIFWTGIKKVTDAKTIYSVADLHFLRKAREFETTGDPKALQQSQKTRKIEFDIMRSADIVLTLSKFEEEIIKEELPDKQVVVAPIFYYDNFDVRERNVAQTQSIMFIGGFNHTPNVDGVCWFMKEIWPIISERLPDCKLYLLGSHPNETITNFASDKVVVTGYVSDAQLAQYYQTSRVCIIPLRYGAGIKGKFIEAMYNKIPIVSTSIGSEGLENIDEIVPAYDKAEDFAKAVIELYGSDRLIENTTCQYHAYLKQKFSKEYALSLFQNMLRN